MLNKGVGIVIIIRKAGSDDLDRVEEIYNRIHTEEEAGRAGCGWKRGIYPTRDTALQALSRDDLFVMEDEGDVVASAVINSSQMWQYAHIDWAHVAKDEEVMVLHTLTVDSEKGGKGYGKAFVSFYEDYALEHKSPELRMDTNERNVRARGMYKKLGYEERGVVFGTFCGLADVNLVCLEKCLEERL
ncbi:MAG: GNAT family N-acetyltransferase [Lachnospiraceae bacterium]|nr:GNAT family N-acetyltransferase [Lachnospiraceae bacterium]